MFTADFHIHSKYSRATSKECVPEFLDLWARKKGLDVIGTGDFTHPAWRQELRDKLVPTGDGLYTLREELVQQAGVAGQTEAPRFLVTGEISSIYKKNGRVRKVHNVILLPGLDEAELLAHRLEAIGNLHSDGRPILGLDSRDLLEITLEACPQAMLIPAHIWTPHFSLFGAYSGFDTIEECFGDLTGHIHALETGLSSDPSMNWRLSALDRFTLVSNSDAHSPGNLAREANLFHTKKTYHHILRALRREDKGAFGGTLEFYPEEGKYHFDGHRSCSVCQQPRKTMETGGVCPVCGGRITVGVFHRVEELADREEGVAPEGAPGFESLIPLPGGIAASMGHSPKSIKGRTLYDRLLRELGSELHILRTAPTDDVAQVAGPGVGEGVRRLRCGEVEVSPGYDGVYGKVHILHPGEIQELSGQMRLFWEAVGTEKKPSSKAQPKPTSMAKKPVPAKAEKEPTNPDALGDLNPEQQEAAFTQGAVTAVIAGPGTGKTKTLVARIAHLVQRRGVHPAGIVAVTFTNKAAGEMRARLEAHFGNKRTVGAMTIGTFHSICLGLLRREGEAAVIDDAAAKGILQEVLRDRGDKLSVGEAHRLISLQKCGAAVEGESALPQGLYDGYCHRLRELGVLDYDDILLEALALPGDMFAARAGKKRPVYLLVDEFQDVNPVQYQLIKKWNGTCQGLFVIGDPNQSIYGFRGSDFRCFQWLRADYPDRTQVALSRNYRSTPEILAAAAPIVAQRDGLTPQRQKGAPVRLLEADAAFGEALFVVKEINRMVGGMDMLDSGAMATGTAVRGFSDIAVLYRTNRQAELLEDCLRQEGIPYVVAGRDEVLTHPQVVRMLAFFRMLQNPRDGQAVFTVLEKVLGLPMKEVRRSLKLYGESQRDLPALIRALGEDREPGRSLSGLIERYGKAARTAKPAKLIAQWAGELEGEDKAWADRLGHMAVFHKSMEDFLHAVLLGQESDLRRFGGKRYTGDAVTLMTLHGAKGLEFPTVFLCGVSEGIIPHKGFGTPGDDGEERRLLYVGMTRARDELILLAPGAPSPFLRDIPAERLEKAAAKKPRSAKEYKQYSLFD